MARQIRHPLKELRFTGGRFEENQGWLDFDVLPELLAYKNMLVETAKEEWKRCNPDRERLPKGFAENIRLGFNEIREGSCAVPVERITIVDDDDLLGYVEDEVDEAARIIDATLIAVRDDTPFPERFPARVIPMFDDWGKTLGPDEGIVLDGQNGVSPRFDAVIKERILRMRTERYEDVIDLIGEVRAAGLKAREGGSFTILLENGDSVDGVFTDAQETCITEALHEHRQARLRMVGLGEFEGSGHLKRILRVDQIEVRTSGETSFDPSVPPIWETIAELGRTVPDEEWAKVPADLAENLDHYLYGEPKEDGR